MKYTVNPEMLILARESRGMTQKDVAMATSISQGNISKYESGFLNVNPEHLEIIADALSYPVTFFFIFHERQGFGSACMYHRKRESASVQDLKTLQARLNILRFQVEKLLNSTEIQSSNQFLQLDLDEYRGDAEEIARRVRAEWRLPFGPIPNLIGAVERAGGIVFRSSFPTLKVDAVSNWPPHTRNVPPILLVNEANSADRCRFTLSHEIGHLIMHRIATEDPEKEADRFAAEFLMPAKEIAPYLSSLTLPKLAQLKSYWKVSMQAIIRRAFDLNKITEWQYRSLFIQFSKMGYKTNEPVELPDEHPTLARKLIEAHSNELEYTSDEITNLIMIYENEITRLYNLDKPGKLKIVNFS